MSEDMQIGKFGKGAAVGAGLLILLLAALGYFVFLWGFCRFYVPPGQMAIVTAKVGKTPAAGSILVEPGEKGIWREVLAEGRHFLNPIDYEVKIVPAIEIPLGKIGIVTAKVGRELASGEIITADRAGKGVWRSVLGPGVYRLNPQGYQVDIVDAVNIPVGYVGVVTSQTGKAPKPGEFAGPGEKGVLKDILQPGLYYINSRADQVNVIEIGMNQVTMTGEPSGSIIATRNQLNTAGSALDELQFNTLNMQREQRMEAVSELRAEDRSFASRPTVAAAPGRRVQAPAKPGLEKEKADAGFKKLNQPQEAALPAAKAADAAIYGASRLVEFPSRDGFKIMIEMTVEFELMPEHISKIYLLYGDLPQVVDKIILPQVLSLSRLKGSSYKAQDFIMGEGRETFQNDLRDDLVRTLAEKNILVHNAIIRNVEIPNDILTPIRAVSLAREQNLTNLSLQETAKIQAELNTEIAMIQQRQQEVEQNTRKLVAEIAANRRNAVEKTRAETALGVADIMLKKSEVEARSIRLRGESAVKVDFAKQNELAAGALLKSQVLGKPGIMAELRLVESLNPQIETRIIHAGEGTLWTDLKGLNVTVPVKK